MSCVQESDLAVLSQAALTRLLDLEEEAHFFGDGEERTEAPTPAGPTTLMVAGTDVEKEVHLSGDDGEERTEALTPAGPTTLMVAGTDVEKEVHFSVDDGEERAVAPAPRPTTLMVRNVACKLKAAWIRAEIDALGFGDAYDFFYLPLFRTCRSNQGYFFLNFKNERDAERFAAHMQGRSLGDSAKLCEVVAAQWQGLDELHKQFDSTRVMKNNSRPVFL